MTNRVMWVVCMSVAVALAPAARTSAEQEERKGRKKYDGGLFEEATKAQLEGKAMPAGFRTTVPRTQGDDAKACHAARQGDLKSARTLAASDAMRKSLESGQPIACPDAAAAVPAAPEIELAPEKDPAMEHPLPGTCGEVGLWDDQVNPSIFQTSAYTIESTVSVANIPGMAPCGGSTVPSTGTQHNSLHARSADGSLCLELVSQRFTGGFTRMWGYDCGAGGPANIMDIPSYGSPWMYFWMSTGGSGTTWYLWFYRYDTSQWVYLGPVANRAATMRPWVESSGYNATLERRTLFANYRATNAFGSWTPRVACAVREAFDAHQVMFQSPVTGGTVRFDHQADGIICR
jgi:hypothetical protein